MPERPWRDRPRRALAALAALALAVAACSRGDAPEPVAWNRQACDHCRMLVGDPAFAAQLRDGSGQVRFFDDPGCLLAFAAERGLGLDSAWFHHPTQERWIPGGAVGFAESPRPTPMGYGLVAVEREASAGALDAAAALERVRARDAARRGP